MKAIAVVSGGLDSVTMAHWFKLNRYDIDILSVHYGQRHHKELFLAKECADRLGVRWDVVDLRTVGALLGSSSLTNSHVDVPDGHYANGTMKITIVPNRNAILLSIAVAVAVSRQADVVGVAVHGGDHFIYPDCRPLFINKFQVMSDAANEGQTPPQILAPFLSRTKAEIVQLGAGMSVPFDKTWSCYKGGEKHCGACGTCVERKEAFKLANVKDPTEYMK